MKKILASLLIISAVILLSSCSNGTDESPMSIGKVNAPVLIEEFSDVECPACSKIGPMVEELAKNNADIVRLEFHHFPLSYHKHAFMGAEAVECAEDQNKGWEYLNDLFKNQKSLTDDYFYALANTLDLNTDKFKACLDGHAKKAKILSYLRDGKARGLPGTPTLYINGKMVKWAGIEAMDAYIKGLVR